jgi:hypothetical protein
VLAAWVVSLLVQEIVYVPTRQAPHKLKRLLLRGTSSAVSVLYHHVAISFTMWRRETVTRALVVRQTNRLQAFLFSLEVSY